MPNSFDSRLASRFWKEEAETILSSTSFHTRSSTMTYYPSNLRPISQCSIWNNPPFLFIDLDLSRRKLRRVAEQDLGMALFGRVCLILRACLEGIQPGGRKSVQYMASLINRAFGMNQDFLCVFVQVFAHNLQLIMSVSSNCSTPKSNIQSWQSWRTRWICFWFPTFPKHKVHRLIPLSGFIVQADLLTRHLTCSFGRYSTQISSTWSPFGLKHQPAPAPPPHKR